MPDWDKRFPSPYTLSTPSSEDSTPANPIISEKRRRRHRTYPQATAAPTPFISQKWHHADHGAHFNPQKNGKVSCKRSVSDNKRHWTHGYMALRHPILQGCVLHRLSCLCFLPGLVSGVTVDYFDPFKPPLPRSFSSLACGRHLARHITRFVHHLPP